MSCNNLVCPFHEIQASDYLSSDSDMKCLITNTVKQVRFGKGEILFAQGQPSDSLFSLSSGIVKITYHTQDGREQIIGLSTPGKLLVGLQSINNDYYEYSAVAETETYACKVRHRALLRTAQKRGEVAMRLVDALNAQLAHSRSLMTVMGHKCAASKIASFIKLIVPSSEHGNRRYTLPFSRSEIANLLGLSEETVCRRMAEMRRRGILYAPRGKIEILDWEQLHDMADEPCAAG
ncbi:MAG: Crp/Fnr family transcriptional regulator [Gammaproteobacteria bacterium]|nr:Crp/Fnr family transcriptional regulator [Gammaproteobacteria bacterium]MDH5617312.1 Crp/Fnr family transcriptional regulator [Gammaproteobacteria bacterium]